LSSFNFDAHCPAQNIEDLINVVHVQTGRRPSADRRLDAENRTRLGPRGVVEQRLGQPVIGTAPVDGREIDLPNVFH
jgi:hypothetical protein